MAKADDMCATMERIIAPVESKSNPPWRKESESCYKVELTVDSGAFDSVSPADTIPGLVPGKGKSMDPYYAANGTEVKNYGSIGIKGLSADGKPMACDMQVAGVTKPLIATADMTAAGNVVLLTDVGGVAKKLPKEIVDQIFALIKSAPGHGVPIEKKGRKHAIEITVPKVVKKKAVIAESKPTPVHNMFSALNRNDMEIGERFLRPAVKA